MLNKLLCSAIFISSILSTAYISSDEMQTSALQVLEEAFTTIGTTAPDAVVSIRGVSSVTQNTANNRVRRHPHNPFGFFNDDLFQHFFKQNSQTGTRKKWLPNFTHFLCYK